MQYMYRCGRAGCDYQYSAEFLAWARREGRNHQLHAHEENPPDPLVVDMLITTASAVRV